MLRRLDSLLTVFITCEETDREISMDRRRQGLNMKLSKLKRAVLRGVCSAYAVKNDLETDCNDLSQNVEHRYEEVIKLLTNSNIQLITKGY